MLKVVLFCVLAGCTFVLVQSMSGSRPEPGVWSLDYVTMCSESENYIWEVEVMRGRKENTTYESYKTLFWFSEGFDDQIEMKIEVSKECDGGVKQFHTMKEMAIDYLNRTDKESLDEILKHLSFEDSYLPQGNHSDPQFIVNYCNYPCEFYYGNYIAHITLSHQSEGTISCIMARATFQAWEDDNMECKKCEKK